MQHNDYDYDCVNWWGDRTPPRGRNSNREFSGEPTRLWDRRCLVCRPYTEEEANELLEFQLAPVVQW